MSSRLLTYSSCAQWPGLDRGWAGAGPGLDRGWTGATAKNCKRNPGFPFGKREPSYWVLPLNLHWQEPVVRG